MIKQSLKHHTINAIRRLNSHACPECGMGMTEVERVEEGDYVFVWYECIQKDCPGQWLEKKKLLSEKCSA